MASQSHGRHCAPTTNEQRDPKLCKFEAPVTTLQLRANLQPSVAAVRRATQRMSNARARRKLALGVVPNFVCEWLLKRSVLVDPSATRRVTLYSDTPRPLASATMLANR